MDDEFALCWNNFQDNIASGFLNLYDRGDLVDVTIACDGKLLHAHKIVLAICSPYFQEMFITNPCKHPIIILKDVSYNVMCELLQFMYQGVVNVKHTELSTFMKIAQMLQVKGLATSSSSSSHTQRSPSHHHHHQLHHHFHHQQQQQQQQHSTSNSNNNNNNNNKNGGNGNNNNNNSNNNNNNNDNNSTENSENLSSPSPTSLSGTGTVTAGATSAGSGNGNNGGSSGTSGSGGTGGTSSGNGGNVSNSSSLKRVASEFFNSMSSIEGLSILPRKQMKRFSMEHNNNNNNNNSSDHDINNDSMDNMNSSDDVFLPPIPQISMIESRFDLNSVKRESHNNSNSNEFIGIGGNNSITGGGGPGSLIAGGNSMRNALPPPFNFEYGLYAGAAVGKSSIEYPNELHMGSDYPKGLGNHMDIPSVAPGERWFHGKLEFMLSQRGKPLLVYDGHTFGIQYIRKDKKYWQCNLSRKFNCKARVTTTETGEIIVTNNEHCHTEIRQHLRKDYHRNKLQNNNNNNSNNSNNKNNDNKHNSTCTITTGSEMKTENSNENGNNNNNNRNNNNNNSSGNNSHNSKNSKNNDSTNTWEKTKKHHHST